VIPHQDATAHAILSEAAGGMKDLIDGLIDGYGTGAAVCYDLEQRSQARLAIADIHPFEVPETFAFAIRAASGLETALTTFIEHYRQLY